MTDYIFSFKVYDEELEKMVKFAICFRDTDSMSKAMAHCDWILRNRYGYQSYHLTCLDAYKVEHKKVL